MWNYIFYTVYLDFKPVNDLTGNEQYIKEMIKSDNLNWLPIKRFITNKKYIPDNIKLYRKR